MVYLFQEEKVVNAESVTLLSCVCVFIAFHALQMRTVSTNKVTGTSVNTKREK